MAVRLNHTIVAARDKKESAAFLAEIHPRHYAFLVTEPEFDQIFERIRSRGLEYWADPFERQPGEINTHDGGRGVYWQDPSGHKLEIITRPYGS